MTIHFSAAMSRILTTTYFSANVSRMLNRGHPENFNIRDMAVLKYVVVNIRDTDMIYNTDVPAYSDPVYSDTPLTVTLLAGPK